MTREELITRLIAVLSTIIDALIDASLLPRATRKHLRALCAAYFAHLTALLTTPAPVRVARAPRAAKPPISTTPRSANPRGPARRQPREPAAIAATAPAKAQPTARQNRPGAALRVLAPTQICTTPIPPNLQKPVFAPTPLRA